MPGLEGEMRPRRHTGIVLEVRLPNDVLCVGLETDDIFTDAHGPDTSV